MKPRIFYLHATQASLSPTAGDKINEMATIRALSRHFDVYYNGELVEPTDQTFGRGDGRIVIPEPGRYDLVYVRANRDVFLAAPPPKILMATPYDAECFAAADGLVVTTQVWKERLEKFSAIDTDYFMGIYPPDFKISIPVLLFDQVFDTPTDANLTELKSRFAMLPSPPRRRPSILETVASPFLARHKDNEKIIAHLGPIKKSNFPHQLIRHYKSDRDFKRDWKLRAYGAGNKIALPKEIQNLPRVSFEDSLAIYAALDATWMNHNKAVNFVGSLKTIHAMAFGLPILLPAFDTPVRRLGQDYPLLWRPDPSLAFDAMHPDFKRALACLLSLDEPEKRQMAGYLRDRSLHFSTERVAASLRQQIEDFLGNWSPR